MLSEVELQEMKRGMEKRMEATYDNEFGELAYAVWIVKNILNGELIY